MHLTPRTLSKGKMKKSGFAVLAAFLMLTTSVSAPAMAAEASVACSLGGTFTTVDGLVTEASEDCAGVVTIPAEVTKIAEFAFAEKVLITEVNFEAGSQLVEISAWAFENTKFSSITLPSGLKTMDFHAFNGTKFTSISIPATVESMGAAFRNSGLESLTFEPGFANNLPPTGTFDNSSKLKSVTFQGPNEFSREPFRIDKFANDWAGWSTSPGGPLLSFPLSVGSTGITLIPRFDPRTYNATYNSAGGSAVAPGLIIGGQIEFPTPPTREGYVFEGWSDSEDSNAAFIKTWDRDADATFYARWIPTYSVSLDPKGGVLNSAASIVAIGKITSAPKAPSRAGYTFQGWSDAEAGEVISFPYTPSTVGSITLYAKWSLNPLFRSVFLDSTGGSGVQSALLAVGGEMEQEPEQPERAGYTFEGWSDAEFGQVIGFPYSPSGSEDITLYAKWIRNIYAVKFNSTGGSTVADESFVTESLIVVAPAAPTRAGYRFAGWTAVEGGVVVSFPYIPGVTEDITLYAKWAPANVRAAATVKPTISGVAKLKSKLTAKPGTWTGSPAPKLAYQWYSCAKAVTAATATIPKTCKALSGKISSTLTLATADKGKFIAVRVTGTSAGTSATLWLSKSTAAVK